MNICRHMPLKWVPGTQILSMFFFYSSFFLALEERKLWCSCGYWRILRFREITYHECATFFFIREIFFFLFRHCRLCFPDHLSSCSGDRNRSFHDSGLDCSGLGCFSDFIEESDATESTVDDILTLPRSCVCVSKLFAKGTAEGSSLLISFCKIYMYYPLF